MLLYLAEHFICDRRQGMAAELTMVASVLTIIANVMMLRGKRSGVGVLLILAICCVLASSVSVNNGHP